MRIVLLGKGDRGRACLTALRAAGQEVVGVIVAAGEPVEWDAEGALRLASINGNEGLSALARSRPDLLVLAGYTEILKPPVLRIPARGAINTHGGRVPQYRGSSVLNWQVLRGEPTIGISILQVDERIDAGDILAESSRSLGPEETIRDVLAWSLEEFPRMVVDVVTAIERGTAVRRSQEAGLARTFAHRTDDDGELDWRLSTAAEVHDLVRALASPYPGAWTRFSGARMRIWRTRPLSETILSTPGKVAMLARDGVAVMARDRCVELLEVQPPGTPDPIPAREALRRGDWLR